MIDRAVADPVVLQETADVYLGQWNQLVSMTNWEKGRIILSWREALIAAGAEASEYADDVWSGRVGNVSGQHVGRLRRVFERFGNLRQSYGKLYWSHFQAALDWDDAEMWLEGALQSGWSISEMRRQRWEAIGGPDELKPRDEDILVGEVDEDSGVVEAAQASSATDEAPFDAPTATGTARETASPTEHTPSAQEFNGDSTAHSTDDDQGPEYEEARYEPVRPFANLAELPDDLSDAFESFKLAILRHKLAGWTEISMDDVLGSLDSLKQLATAPAE